MTWQSRNKSKNKMKRRSIRFWWLGKPFGWFFKNGFNFGPCSWTSEGIEKKRKNDERYWKEEILEAGDSR